MINCIIVEDQVRAQRVLEKYIAETELLIPVGTFFSAPDALNFINKNKVDLIFLDIHLPGASGIDLINSLDNNKPFIVATTAYPNYAILGYELNITDYLLKPFSIERFRKAVDKVVDLYKLKNTRNHTKVDSLEKILVKDGHEKILLNLNDILFIKSEGDYTMVYCKCKRYLLSYTLKFWNENLPNELFIQVHRSYIVNKKYVEKINASMLFIEDTEIPIGRIYKKQIKNII